MMEAPLFFGIDVGTTKVCTLVARLEPGDAFRILGVGIEPSQGMRKGVVVDLEKAAQAVGRSIEKAERAAGVEITAAWVSVAGAHVSSINSRGVAGIGGRAIVQDDVERALEAASAVAIPHNREVVHIVQRGFVVDDQDGVRVPVGMHGYRLEVEAHIITAAAASLENLREIVSASGVEVIGFVLNPLASAEVVLSESEREMGVVVCDIGGGTTDMAIYINGEVWHTMVLPVGGNHITADIAHGLSLPLQQAEEIKVQYGRALKSEVPAEEKFSIQPFGESQPVQISRQELAFIIEARVEEMISMMMQEIKRSGYDGLLPAGIVLTGGSAALPGMRDLAAKMISTPVRVAKPQGLAGMTDRLHSPAYSTSVGLIHWAIMMGDAMEGNHRRPRRRREGGDNWQKFIDIVRRLFP